MSHLDVIKLIYSLLLLTNAVSKAAFRKQECEVHGKYRVCFLEQEEVCHPLKKKSDGLKIESLENSAVIIKSHNPIHHLSGLLVDKECRFTIKTKNKDEGLFAVIQNMNFRRNSDGCVDYVQFRRDDGQWSDKWCGEINRKMKDAEIAHNLFSEFDPQGKLETQVFISREPMKPEEYLSLTIVYTPNIKCSRVARKNYRQVTQDICIWKDYICDDYQNCAIDGCDDEKECVRSIVSDGTGTKVTVGAVTTIFLCFILFVTCLWICKKHKKLCWSSDCAGPSNNRSSSSADIEQVTATSAPTAPMLEIAVSSGVQDKDLPPSYDSLFPEQSNTTST